jgi:5-methylcytosine-specific restriction endonuclease McrA
MSMHRTRLWIYQHGLCFYCATYVSADAATIDHFVPMCRGGTNKLNNKVMACRQCNNAKADLDPRTLGIFKPRPVLPHSHAALKQLQLQIIRIQLQKE